MKTIAKTRKLLTDEEMLNRLQRREPVSIDIDTVRILHEEREKRTAHLVSLVESSLKAKKRAKE